MNKEEVKAIGLPLLISAQGGDLFAQHDLLELIRIQVMPKRIGKYINKNRQVDNDDIRQEFMIGVAMSVKEAKLDVGDPIEFLVHKGLYKVKSYMRKFIVQGTMQLCKECGSKSRLNRVDGGYQCKKCGSTHIETVEVEDHNEITLETIQAHGFEDNVLSDMVVAEFKDTLTPGTNVYNLYELMIEKGIDRDNPLVKNYIKEIADQWGGCSTQNVSVNLDKLRSRLEKFMKDRQLSLELAF